MVLRISRHALDQVLAHSRRDHPVEACGIVASLANEVVASKVIEMSNKAASRTFFIFDSKEQFRVFRGLGDRNEVCRVIYHSHTESEAYPSRDDVEYAGNPEAHYLIVSTRKEVDEDVRCFRMFDGDIVEESVAIMDL